MGEREPSSIVADLSMRKVSLGVRWRTKSNQIKICREGATSQGRPARLESLSKPVRVMLASIRGQLGLRRWRMSDDQDSRMTAEEELRALRDDELYAPL